MFTENCNWIIYISKFNHNYRQLEYFQNHRNIIILIINIVSCFECVFKFNLKN